MPKGIKNETTIKDKKGEIVYEAGSILDAASYTGVSDHKIHRALRIKKDKVYETEDFTFELRNK